jgi:hypothetical protein
MLTSTGYSQTCCSGGVPLSNNLGFSVTDPGNWQFMIGYDLNVMNTLKSGTETLNDNTRKRTTHTIMAQAGYTFKDWFSVDMFLPYIFQERILTPKDQPANMSSTSGVGDFVIMPKIRFYNNFQSGIGIKVPIGATELKNEDGFVLSPDLQPGTGAWDLIFWLNGGQELNFRKSMSVYGTVSYRATGSNTTYLGDQTYTFGDEFQITAGIADRLFIGNQIFDPSISIKYRNAKSDNRDEFDLPSTGGEWVFIRPALIFQATPMISIQSNIELPLYANLKGTQVTTTYRINLSIIASLEK